MKTRYKILSFVILGITFVSTGFGASYLSSSNLYLGYFDSDAIENLQEVKKFKELYPEATRGSVIDETGIRTVRFTYFEHDTSFAYDGPNKTPNNIVLEIVYHAGTKSLLDAELTCTFNDTIDISKTIVDSLSKDDCFESDYDKPKPELTIEPHIPEVELLLIQNQIEYLPNKLIVTGGPVFEGDSGCGAVIDTESQTHWFEIDSISEPKEMKLYSENPHQCKVNETSCFCNAQMKLTALTLDEFSYFTAEEEEKFANILIDYLGKENINRTPKFMIGKLNLNYTDSSAVGYCGELWGDNKNDFFSGAIVNGSIKDYGLDRAFPLLCAISEPEKWWERK